MKVVPVKNQATMLNVRASSDRRENGSYSYTGGV